MSANDPTFRRFRVQYLLFILPFSLAVLSWLFFPSFALWLVTSVSEYEPLSREASLLWVAIVGFLFSWYTFLGIAVAGVFAIAAYLARHENQNHMVNYHPFVSFIVPAFNEERNIARCIAGLFRNAEHYQGISEIIIIDDGSRDCTYELAWSAAESERHKSIGTRARVVRHSINLGKVEAIRTGLDVALGGLVAIVDADSCWEADTLRSLVEYILSNGKKAVTGYVHPSSGQSDHGNTLVTLQRLEYSQGLGITRQAQSLGDSVVVVSGAVGLYHAETLRRILNDQSIRSVTEDLEIALEMHKQNEKIGYVNDSKSTTVAPTSLRVLWNQRLRWFTGWLHNTLDIHRDLLFRRSWLTVFLWYCTVFEYGGAVVDFSALVVFPFLWWFAPDRILFGLGLLVFVPYSLLIGLINQYIALRFAYSKQKVRNLLFFVPFYPILRLVNVLARLVSSMKYIFGDNGHW